MFPVLTLIFLIVPIVEIFFLIQVGQVIGASWTIVLVILTAIIGIRLLKQQGTSTLLRAQEKMRAGQMPAREMLEGIGLIVAGTFLLTPGFFTDTVGFCLLVPAIRIWLIHKILSNQVISARFVHIRSSSVQRSTHDPDIIDGVYYKRDD